MKKFLTLSTSFTLLFCIAIAFNISPYLRGPAPYPPDWRWDYQFINTFGKIWLPLLVAGAIIWLYREYETQKRIPRLSLFVLLFFMFQLSVMYFQRAGIGVLLHRIIDPGLNGYFSSSLNIDPLSLFFKNYTKNVLSLYQHAKGHPPFAVLFFYVLNKIGYLFPSLNQLANKVSPTNLDLKNIWFALTIQQRVGALFSTILIPFLSVLTIIPLYKLVELLSGAKSAMRAILLYMFVPSVTLFLPLNDVFLPIFTCWSLYFLVKGINKNSKRFLFFSGLIFSTSLLFSISSLPLLMVFAAVFYICKKKRFAIGMETSFLMGLLILPLSLFLFFGLNPMQLFKVLLTGLPPMRSYKTWVFFNLYDFFIFAGIPIFLAFFANTFELIKKFKVYDLNINKVLSLSFAFMLILLDILGSVRGEVSRIWLPFYPLVIIGAASFLKGFKTKDFIIITTLCVLQLLVMQEFWVTLY